MCCPPCKVPVFSIPQRNIRSTRRDYEPPKDGVPRDIYGKPLKKLSGVPEYGMPDMIKRKQAGKLPLKIMVVEVQNEKVL